MSCVEATAKVYVILDHPPYIALPVCCRKMYCGVFSFPPVVYVVYGGTLYLMASIPGPFILTLQYVSWYK